MKTVVCDIDDFCSEYKKNGLNILFYWKAKFPNFKVNLFTIPQKTSVNFLKLIIPHLDWINLCIHGFAHENNFEVQYWNEELTNKYLDYAEAFAIYSKVFKSPGWQITYPQPYNENPDLSKPVNSNPQLVYNILKERGYTVCDQHYNVDKRPGGLKVYCTCNPLMVHGHTWNMEQGEPNGLEQIENAGVPWDNETEFKFITELTEEQLKCRY